MKRWLALTSMLLALAAGCDGETLVLGERRVPDADDEDLEQEPDAEASPADAAHRGDAGPSGDAAGLDARAQDASRPDDARGDDDDAGSNDWFCFFDTDCSAQRPYCNVVAASFDPPVNITVCLQCRLINGEGCRSGEACMPRWGRAMPEAACLPLFDSGAPSGPPPRGS